MERRKGDEPDGLALRVRERLPGPERGQDPVVPDPGALRERVEERRRWTEPDVCACGGEEVHEDTRGQRRHGHQGDELQHALFWPGEACLLYTSPSPRDS